MAHYKLPVYSDYFPKLSQEEIIAKVIAEAVQEMRAELDWEDQYLMRMQEHCDNVNWDALNS